MFKLIISDPKEGRAWQVEREATPLIGTQIGEEFNGSLIGLEGYTLKVTGGSDREGFPMRKSVQGTGRRKVLMKGGSGYRPKGDGVKARKSVRGNQISEGIVQVNLKVVEREKDVEPIPDLLGIEPVEKESEGEEEPEEKAQEEEEDEQERREEIGEVAEAGEKTEETEPEEEK